MPCKHRISVDTIDLDVLASDGLQHRLTNEHLLITLPSLLLVWAFLGNKTQGDYQLIPYVL